MQRKTRHYTKYSAQYLVFPATFRVILVSWKIDDFWDSAGCSVHFTITIPRRKYRYSKNSKNRNTNYQGVSKFFDHQLCLTNTAGLISGYWNYGVQTKTAGSPPTKNKTYSVCGGGANRVAYTHCVRSIVLECVFLASTCGVRDSLESAERSDQTNIMVEALVISNKTFRLNP